MWSPINWKIASHPLNWLVVLSVILVVAFLADISIRFLSNHPAFASSNEPGSLAAS